MGVPYSWGTGLSKSQLLAGGTPTKMATLLDPLEDSSKPLTYYCSSAYWLQLEREKWRLLLITAAPHTKTNIKMAVFVQLWVVFESWWRDTAVFRRRCHFVSWPPSLNAELKYYVRFLKISPTGFLQIRKKRFVPREWIWKLRGQKLPLLSLAPWLDSIRI